MRPAAVVAAFALFVMPLAAQQTSDAPTIKVGAMVFADYTYAQKPRTTDADGNRVHPSSFNVTRAYINVTGNLNRRIGFRVTPDIARENGSGSSLAGSQTFRLKYAFAQLNAARGGTWLRFGMQPTPFMEFAEPIYHYRFQGPLFEDREGFVSTADSGIGVKALLPSRVELQGGIFNGEGFSKAETNNEKSAQLRATWSPIADGIGTGLRLTAYVHDDRYIEHAARRRLIGQIAYTHPWFNAAIDVLRTKDRKQTSAPEVDGRGFTAFVTPKLGHGWEALLRHDELRPDARSTARKRRDIEGIAYWPAVPKGVSAAIMLDRDSTRGIGATTTNWGIRMMVGF